jgi:hypothetical protein
VTEALRQLCAGRSTYPSHAEFQIAGLDGLHQAIRARHGGHQLWADRFGLPRSGKRPPRPSVLRWTDDLVDERLRRVIAELGLDRYPLQRELYRVGEGGLHRHIKATRGHAWWAQQLGLRRVKVR